MIIDVRLSFMPIARSLGADYFDEVNEWFGEIPPDVIAEIDSANEKYFAIAKDSLATMFPGAEVAVTYSELAYEVEVDPPEREGEVTDFVERNMDDWQSQALAQP